MLRINAWFSTIAGLVAALAASNAMAAPALESTCPINNPGDGSVTSAYASEDCSQLFVLPPSTGHASVTAVSPRQNLDFCPAVKQVGVVASSTLSSAATVAQKIEDMIADFDPLSDELDALSAQLNEAARVRNIAKGNLDLLESQKTDLTAEVASAKSDLDLCKLLEPDCSAQQAAYQEAVSALKAFIANEYLPAQKEHVTAKANYDALASAYAAKTSEFANALTPLFDLQNKLFELNTNVNQIYNQYVRLSGFTAALSYSTGWAAAVASYQTANPSKAVTRMPIKRPRVAASAIGVQGFSTDTPAVLGFAIPGIISGQALNLTAMPTGSEGFPKLGSPLDPTVQYENVFGDNIGAQLNVSLMGACPFYPMGLSGGLQGDINNLTAEISMNAFYTYDLQVRRGYEASYNMASWVSRIEKKLKKGGFFSSKTLHEVIEDSNSSDWFSITFNASSSGFSYTPAEQERIAQEVKGQLQERALLLLARQMNLLPSNGQATPPPMQPTGAGTAAMYLMKGCGYWSWCLAGSFVLGVLDSIFGRSEAVSNFKRNNNVWISEKVSGVAFNEQSGALTYVK